MKLTDPKYRYYLYDLGPIIKERALEAKEEKKIEKALAEKGKVYSSSLFQAGRLMAFNEVISIMQQQARGFDIGLEEVGLQGINPDKDLI